MPEEKTLTRTVTAPEMGLVERRPLVVAVAIAALVALTMVAPLLAAGNAFGHDIGFHLDTWADAAQSWRAGVWFPRWAELAAWKYGEPRFIFYPPLSWMLGAALSFLLPWKMVPGAFVVLALALAGVSMFRLAREWLPASDAVLAGALFAANPYHVLVIYQRSAYAELLAGALFPLVALYALRLSRERWSGGAVAPLARLATVCAALWLTDAPAALLASYALLLLLLVTAWRERSAAPLLLGGAALALGMALAAVYIIPAMVEQPWVRIRAVLGPGLNPQDNFLFTSTSDRLHDAFNQMVSTVAVVEIMVLALVGWSTRKRLAKAWWPVVVLGVVASALMLRVTAPVWRVVPQAEFIQFPWRWLVVLGACVALLVAAELATRRTKALGWVVIGVVLLLSAAFVVERSWQAPGGAEVIVENALTTGYEGSAEYAPVATEPKAMPRKAPPELPQESPQASLLIGVDDGTDGSLTDAHAQVQEWRPEERRLTIVTEKPEQVVLRMVSYPAWQVEVNGRVVRTTARARTGEIVVPLAAGKSEIHVWFARTTDRTVGGAVSLVGLLLVVFIAGRSRHATSHSQ